MLTAVAPARGGSERLGGFAEGQLAQVQRARILGGMFDVACERGAAHVTVADVVARSGVSRRTFYELFEDRDDCFLAAFEDALGLASARVLPAYREQSRWAAKLRAALNGLLVFLEEQPTAGRVLVCESLSAGRRTLARRNEVVAALIAAVDEGRTESKFAATLPEIAAEGTVGAVLSILRSQLERVDGEPLVGLLNPLMAIIVTPYLGFAAARRELDRPVKTPVGREHSSSGALLYPFKDAGMRLTYRTVRVLLAVAEQPGASNRRLGELAEIADQGQISKLLARLERAGMLENSGLAPGQGAPNEWTLTPAGRQVTDSISAHTASPRSGAHQR